MMTDKNTIRHLSKAIRGLRVKKFASHLDRYMAASATMDQILGRLPPAQGKTRKAYEKCCAAIEAEASVILSQSASSLKQMQDFQFRLNGQSSGIPETDEKTRMYFRKIRHQQLAILWEISEEVEIICNMIHLSGRMRDITQAHAETLGHTAYLMDIVNERLSQRATPSLKIENKGKEIRQLTGTFQDIRACEDTCHAYLNQDVKKSLPERAFAPYHALVTETRGDIEQRKQKIIIGIRELKQGWKLMKKLAGKGYSRRMDQQLDELIRKNDQRTSEFERFVRESRPEQE